MWPSPVPWTDLRFGVEIEFAGGRPAELALLPGWHLALDERQYDEDGRETGGELTPDPLTWDQREQVGVMLARLQAQGARANWDCGLHVHVGLAPWGQDMVLPLVDAALACQGALRELLQTSDYRMRYSPPVTAAMRAAYAACPDEAALRHRGRPQAHRCGINAAAWHYNGTVEIRLANGSLAAAEVERAVELCLRFVAAVGAGRKLPGTALALARALGCPAGGYPPPQAPPPWRQQQVWLEEALIPAVAPLALARFPGGEVHHLAPVPDGIQVAVELPGGRLERVLCRWGAGGWELG